MLQRHRAPRNIVKEPNIRYHTYTPISEALNEIGSKIIAAAIAVHKELESSLLEKVYEVCFCHELKKRGLNYKRQVAFPVVYDGIEFEEGLRLNVLVEDTIVCELKALDLVNSVWDAQIISHLKLSDKLLGYLLNFNSPLMKQGIKRFINTKKVK